MASIIRLPSPDVPLDSDGAATSAPDVVLGIQDARR
jgi:hypothetical protein